MPGLPPSLSPLLLLVGPPFHILVFTVATCLICVTRRPFYAGILATLFAAAVIYVPQLFEALRWLRFNQLISDIRNIYKFDVGGYLAYAGTLLGLAVSVFAIAYLVVRRRLR